MKEREMKVKHTPLSFLAPRGKNIKMKYSYCVKRRKWGFPSGSAVKTLPTVKKIQDTWVQSQGQEDSLEKGKSILAWRIPMQRVGHD